MIDAHRERIAKVGEETSRNALVPTTVLHRFLCSSVWWCNHGFELRRLLGTCRCTIYKRLPIESV